MFQDMSKALNQSMSPFRELVDIQTKMLEQLTQQQMACTKACIDATMQQTQELQNCSTPEQLLELQKAYASQLEASLVAANESNMKALADAQASVEKLAQDSFEAFATKP